MEPGGSDLGLQNPSFHQEVQAVMWVNPRGVWLSRSSKIGRKFPSSRAQQKRSSLSQFFVRVEEAGPRRSVAEEKSQRGLRSRE